tara:strand:- start:306 stop:1133 length:828 start_codon:yes stop_codon:yes gene_type:complete
MIPYILTDESLTVVVNGKSLTMESSNPSFREAVKAISDERWDDIEKLFDTSQAVEDYADGKVKVVEGVVYYDGEAVHNHVVGRILDFMRQGLPYKPLVRFLDKLMGNPSRRAVNELYAFLEHKAMPLTPDGNFLAYKGVREDYTDWHSGKFSNKVGDVNEMTRNRVCDDANIGCSHGFHAGSLDYAKGYGNGGHLMVVEIDPRDVVSVPLDCDQQKLRTAKYKVVAHFEKKLEEPMCDDYDDYDDYKDWEDCDSDNYNEGYDAGYEAGKAAAASN